MEISNTRRNKTNPGGSGTHVLISRSREGLAADLLIGGSLAVGQSVNHSDVDVFAVVTPEDGVQIRTVVDAYQAKFSQETGRYIDFSVTGDVVCITVNNLSKYLDSTDFVYSTRSPSFIGLTSYDLKRFHSGYQTSLGIGSCRLGLIQKIEALKEDPKVARVLISAFVLSGFSRSFCRSFEEYEWRLFQHPDFSSLPETEKEQFVEYLEERQRQFLFYIENPRYCKWPDETVSDR